MVRRDSKREILRYIDRRGSATGPELAAHLGVSRQAVSVHLRRLIASGQVFKTGSTRAARYFPAAAAPPARKVRRELGIPGLDEAVVYGELELALNLTKLRSNVGSILRYAFTEMLNNAIDHSMADRCRVKMRFEPGRVTFSVRDRGIGVFHSIADKFDLDDEETALIELLKGKTTTQPQAHSGEGIFFVSRVADRFALRSHRLSIEWDRDRDDVFVSDRRFLEGTLVDFEVRTGSRTRLEEVFAQFAPEEYDFHFARTRILVRLLRSEYVSRSEAKRLLHNLDRFSEIELDMRAVHSVGQGFADEVFRVFAGAHPDVRIRALNAGKAVEAMIRHVGGQRDR